MLGGTAPSLFVCLEPWQPLKRAGFRLGVMLRLGINEGSRALLNSCFFI